MMPSDWQHINEVTPRLPQSGTEPCAQPAQNIKINASLEMGPFWVFWSVADQDVCSYLPEPGPKQKETLATSV